MTIESTTLVTRRPGIYRPGRRHTHVGDGVRCITVLCTYDPGPECFSHTAEAEAKREELEDLQALMRQAA